METNQTAAQPVQPVTSYSPGIFGTKIPSVVAFAIGVLLFFLPFVDIKCNNMSLQEVTGFQLAKGFEMKENKANNPFGEESRSDNEETTTAPTSTKKKDPNIYALVAMGLGILGLVLSLTNAKAAIGGAMVTGILSAGALIGLMLDIKKKIKIDTPSIPKSNTDSEMGSTLDKLGDNIRITADFTPWFYVAVIAFLAAAFFSYRRMQVK